MKVQLQARAMFLGLFSFCIPELYVHLTFKSILLSLKQKKEVISNAYKWMRDIGLHPTELVLSWWRNEKDVETIVNELNLCLVKKDEYRVLHDHELLDLK